MTDETQRLNRFFFSFFFSLTLNTVDSHGGYVSSMKSPLSSFESPSRFLLDHPRLTAPCFVFTCFNVCSVTHAYTHIHGSHVFIVREKWGGKKRNERRRLACVYHSTNFAIRKKNGRYTAKQYQIYIYILYMYLLYISILRGVP